MQKLFRNLNKINKNIFKSSIQRNFSQNSNTEQEVLFKYHGNLMEMTLNRPHRLNSWNINMVNLIENELKNCLSSKNINTFIMKGAGDKSFSSGGDLRQHLDNYWKQVSDNDTFVRQVVEHNYNCFIMEYNLAILRQIVQISIFNGYVMGQGAGMGMFAPVKIATDKTIFAMPEGRIGFFVDAGASYFLTQLRKNLGMYLALTGARIKGPEIYQTGLAHHFVPSDQIRDLEEKLVDFSNSQQASSLNKEDMVGEYHELIENFNRKKFNRVIDNHFENEDYIQELFEVQNLQELFNKLEMREGNPFAKEISEQMKLSCPWSLYTNFELFQKSKTEKLSVRDCIKLDFRLVIRFVARKDFFEGIRCALIDREDSPQWEVGNIQEISRQDILEQLNKIHIKEFEDSFEQKLQEIY